MVFNNINIIIFGLLSFFGFIFTLLVSFFAFKKLHLKKDWHIHFRSILCIGIISLIISSILNVLIGVIEFCLDFNVFDNSLNIWTGIYKKVLYTELYFNHYYRYIQWSICIERLISTIKIKIYEKVVIKYVYCYVIIVVGILSYLTCEAPNWGNINERRHLIFIFIDIPIYIICSLLWYTNKRMAIKQNLIIKSLSQKFQVNENLFLFWLYFPILTIYLIQQLIFHTLVFFLSPKTNPSNFFYYMAYTIRTFVLLYPNLAIALESFFYKKYIKINKISNTFNDNIMNNDDINKKIDKEGEAYFNMLKIAWN